MKTGNKEKLDLGEALASCGTQGSEDGREAFADLAVSRQEWQARGTDGPAAKLKGGFHRDGIGCAKQGLENREKLLMENQGFAISASQKGLHHGLNRFSNQVTGHAHHADSSNGKHRQREGIIAAVDGQLVAAEGTQLLNLLRGAARGLESHNVGANQQALHGFRLQMTGGASGNVVKH
jgi:hypothetical protein